jgi:hypothetical protein
VLAHPRSSDLARNAICVFRQGEQEDEDQLRIVNLRNMSREPARIDNSLHGLASCLHRRVGHWVAQVQVVDDDVHEPDLTPWGHHVLWRHSRTAHPMLVEFEGELELGGLSRSLTSPPADNDDSERRHADQSKNQERNLDSPVGCRVPLKRRPGGHLNQHERPDKDDARPTSSSHQQCANREQNSEDHPDQADLDRVQRLADREQDGDSEKRLPCGHGPTMT